MKIEEKITIALSGFNAYEIDGVKDLEFPPELNSFIIVMTDGKKYLVQVTEYNDDE